MDDERHSLGYGACHKYERSMFPRGHELEGGVGTVYGIPKAYPLRRVVDAT